MLFEYYGIKSEEKELRKLFKTTPARGTYWKLVEEGMKQLGMKFIYLRNESIQSIEDLIKSDTPVVVSIDSSVIGGEEEVNHVMIVVGIDGNDVIINDPEAGENVNVNKEDFLAAWMRRDNRMGYLKK